MDTFAEVLKWLALLGLLYALYEIWRRLNTEWEKEKEQALGTGDSEQGDESDSNSEELNDSEEPSQNSSKSRFERRPRDNRSDKLKEILENDPSLADDIKKLAGVPDDLDLTDPDVIKEIAEILSKRALQILDVVSKNPILDIDLDSKFRLQKTNSGGVYQESRPIKNLSEVPKMRGNEWALPRALRRHRILTGQAQKIQRYDLVQDKKKFSVLEDASGSMIENRLHGLPRYFWSRGKIVNLARQAVAGNTEFVYREFNEHALEPIIVKTKEQAQEFLEWAIVSDPNTGGTHIYNALKEATKDVKEGEVLELLLITDGEDKSIEDPNKVRKLLQKGDIRLHVIVIGSENESLKKVATTYQVVN